MKFYSTNKESEPTDFRNALLRGLAPDGGLFMPEKFTSAKNFNEAIAKFVNIPSEELKQIIDDAFNFPVPLVKLDENLYILELFHGPTLSFKDFGARFMARVMNYFVNENLKSQNEKLNIIVATSGDTGSAVANGFYGLPNIKVFVLYPSKRISSLQEKQIATLGKNIVALEVKGDFDDCQRLVKTALTDQELRKKIDLSSANSINIGRLLPQMIYYFKGYKKFNLQLTTSNSLPVFVVPSGNFGNLTAGLFAKKLGLPIKKFIGAVNVNSGVPEFLNGEKPSFAQGFGGRRKTIMTLSNAMDVGNPSNWARITDLYNGDRKAIARDVEAITVSEAKTKKTIADVYRKYGYIADPHTAVGVAAALKSKTKEPKIVLATAHPAKFREIMEKEIGKKISLPKQLSAVSKKSLKGILLVVNYQDLKNIIFAQ